MNLHEVFNNAIWLTSTDDAQDAFILRGHFTVHNVQKAMIRVVGLGFFHCYINGQEVTEDQFLPLNSDFEARDNYPTGEVCLVPMYGIRRAWGEHWFGEFTVGGGVSYATCYNGLNFKPHLQYRVGFAF